MLANCRLSFGASAFCGAVVFLAVTLTGCATLPAGAAPRFTPIAAAARPLLTLDPDAVWTDCFNELVAHGSDSLAYLFGQPAMQRPAAPDDLNVLIHTSLIRALAGRQAPRLTASCFETTLGVLHFDVRVLGRPLGTVVITGVPPAAWPDLFPAEFDQRRAAGINLEADRQALQAWWALRGQQGTALTLAPPLQPASAHLWRLLARQYADAWLYELKPHAVRCAAEGPPRQQVLMQATTRDYNVVRATCIWLGRQTAPEIRQRLIELVGSRLQVVAYNARFALRHSGDPAIIELLDRYAPPDPATVPKPTRRTVAAPISDPAGYALN